MLSLPLMVNVCFYVTGHGLGHATRSLELIRSLLQHQYVVHIVSPVNEDFFVKSLDYDKSMATLFHHSRSLDSGAIQTGPLNVDPHKTLDAYYHIHKNREELLRYEVAWLTQTSIDIVIVDATPLGCIAGRMADKYVVLVTNFSWDYIYQEMYKTLQQPNDHDMKDNHDSLDSTTRITESDVLIRYQEMIHQASSDVSSFDLYIQLPGETPPPLQCPHEKVLPGPLIARIALTERQVAWKQRIIADYLINVGGMNKGEDSIHEQQLKILLLGFGGHAADWELHDAYLPEGWICLLLGTNKNTVLPSKR